jgi:imidazolonepropionase-like amidohydrolase
MIGRPIAIAYGTLYTNDAAGPLRSGTLLIENGTVTAAGEVERIPADALRLEAACVVPGLINAHAHLEMSGEAQTTNVFVLTTPVQRAYVCAENARKALHAGVTTIRDTGGSSNLAIDLRDAIAAGRLPGPTILAAGRVVCMTGGHGWWVGREADGPADVRKAVREERKAGADCIKFIATGGVLTKGAVPAIEQLSEDELRAGIDEAHTHQMRCAAHAIGTQGIKNALRAGIDSIEHGHLLDDECIELFKQHGAYLVPTLAALACILEAGGDSGQPDFVIRKATEIGAHAIANLRKAHAAGVTFAGGSDAGTPFNYHDRYWYEFELMQTQLGMSAQQALYAATASAADLLGVNRGRLRNGAQADVLLLGRDIGDDLHALRDPAVVIKDGTIAIDRRR